MAGDKHALVTLKGAVDSFFVLNDHKTLSHLFLQQWPNAKLPWQRIILAARQSSQIDSISCCELRLPFIPLGLRQLNTLRKSSQQNLDGSSYWKLYQKNGDSWKIPRDAIGKVQLAASYGFPAENRNCLCNLVLIFLVGCGWFSGISLVTTLLLMILQKCLGSLVLQVSVFGFCHFSIFLCCMLLSGSSWKKMFVFTISVSNSECTWQLCSSDWQIQADR